MMYSQQEYDMVRRQTMQIEAEKRALLRWALIAVTLLLAGSLVLTALMYSRYSSADSEVREANLRATNIDAQLQQVKSELSEKKAILEKNAATIAKQNETIQTTIPKMLNKSARDTELAELAHAIYQQPGHEIELPSMPPNAVNMRSVRLRVDGRPYKYTFVAGVVNAKWHIYSVLVKNQEDR